MTLRVLGHCRGNLLLSITQRKIACRGRGIACFIKAIPSDHLIADCAQRGDLTADDRFSLSRFDHVGGPGGRSLLTLIILKSNAARLFAPERRGEQMPGVMVCDLQDCEERAPQQATPRRRVWRRASVSTAAILALLGVQAAIVTPACADDGNSAKQLATVSVPPGSLDQGLAALGQQTNLKLVYPSALTTGKKQSASQDECPPKTRSGVCSLRRS